jgi:hypothetical protein
VSDGDIDSAVNDQRVRDRTSQIDRPAPAYALRQGVRNSARTSRIELVGDGRCAWDGLAAEASGGPTIRSASAAATTAISPVIHRRFIVHLRHSVTRRTAAAARPCTEGGAARGRNRAVLDDRSHRFGGVWDTTNAIRSTKLLARLRREAIAALACAARAPRGRTAPRRARSRVPRQHCAGQRR